MLGYIANSDDHWGSHIQSPPMNGLLVQHGAGGIETDGIFLTPIETRIYFMNQP
jgi:hypothetical protein